MKKSKYQQYFYSFIVCISSAFRCAALIRGEALISMWIPKGAAFIRGRRLFEARSLLGKIRWSRYQILAQTDNFDFLYQICPKRVFLVENRKSEHHH